MNYKEQIENADLVLIGIGEAFQEKFDCLEFAQNLTDIEIELKKREYLKTIEADQVIDFYNKLAELLEGKNYYIVTTCDDDKIFKSKLRRDRITAPCGSFERLQCSNNCNNEIYSTEEYVNLTGDKLVCPTCGASLQTNRFRNGNYNEAGYLDTWNHYSKWLQGTINKNVFILELGVGMGFPSVIRWPFEKIAYYNQKSTFVRVHKTLYQMPVQLDEKGIYVKENPLNFVLAL